MTPVAGCAVILRTVSKTVLVEFQIPEDWARFRLPKALDRRLQELLDRQDRHGKLSPAERREAEALVGLVDMFSLIKLRARVASQRKPK